MIGRITLLLFSIFLLACNAPEKPVADKISADSLSADTVLISKKEIVNKIARHTFKLKFPVEIRTEYLSQIHPYAIPPNEFLQLLPESFDPEGGYIFEGIGHYELDSNYSVCFVHVLLPDADGPGTNEVYMLLYNRKNDSVKGMLVTNSDAGYGFSKFDDATHFRNVTVDQMEDIHLNCIWIQIKDGDFVTENELNKSWTYSEANKKECDRIVDSVMSRN